MIRDRDQYLQASDALRELEEALAALRMKLGDRRPALFAAMAQDYQESIASLRGEIDAYTGLLSVEAASAPLWFCLDGADLSPKNVRTSLLAQWLERLRKATVAVSEYGAAGPDGRRMTDYVSDAFDFRMLRLQPGSLKIGLEIPEPPQGELFDDLIPGPYAEARNALDRLLQGAADAVDLQRAAIALVQHRPEILPSTRALYKQVLRIVPGRRERVRAVVLEGALVPRPGPVRLEPSLRPFLASLLGDDVEPTSVEEIEGTLREIDLDRKHFIVRDRPENLPDVKVYFELDLLADAKGALDSRVRVEASRGAGPRARLRALVIEVLEGV